VDQALDSLLALRQKDPTYRRSKSMACLPCVAQPCRDKIVKADLEGGIYDLNMANQFGPLDAEHRVC